jgi:hypothetical protein
LLANTVDQSTKPVTDLTHSPASRLLQTAVNLDPSSAVCGA